MYNEELKNRFLMSVSGVPYRRKVTGTFEVIAPYEEECGGDICSLSAEQVEQIINATKMGIRYHSMGDRLVALRRYCRWCLDNNVPGATDALLKVQADRTDIEAWKRKTVRSPLHLQTLLDRIFKPEAELSSDLTARAYLWLAFSGIPEKAAPEITADHFDFGLMVINYDGIEFMSVRYPDGLGSS